MPIPLLERSDREMARRIQGGVRALPEVADCQDLKIGFTRKKPNIHFHVLLNGNPSLEETHRTCSKIDMNVRSLVPNARVVINSEPSDTKNTGEVWKIVKRTAEEEPGSRGVQNIHLTNLNDKLGVDFSLQVSSIVSGKRAGEFEAGISRKLKAAEPRLSEVVIHQLSVPYLVFSEQWGHGTEMRAYVEHVSKRFPEIISLGPPVVWKMSDGLHIADRVAFAPGTRSERAAQIRSEFGEAIKSGYPTITRVEIIEEKGTNR